MAIPKVTPTQAELDSTKRGGKHRADKHGAKHAGHGTHRAKHHATHHGTWNDKHWRWVPTADGEWRVQGYIFHHKHKPPKHHFRGPGPKPPRRAAAAASAAAVAATAAAEGRPSGSYAGEFGLAQANRLLNRAGFGPGPGQAQALVAMGLVGAVQSLTRPSGAATLSGPPPVDDEGHPIAPADIWGHDHLWWLDRMIRSDQPLVERMALVFHDWFATSEGGVSKAQQMIDQSNLFRANCFGSFLDLFKAVTVDPAMLQWLNGDENVKGAPNENYAREMQELFSLGADRGAYTEDDIREQARALTGWTYEWSSELGSHNFHFEPRRHDTGLKTVYGQTGNWGWEDACRLCVENPYHPSFFVTKLWSYFVGSEPSAATVERLSGLYVSSGLQIRPLLEEILLSPDFYEGPPMVKPPVVHLASMLRAVGRYVDTTAWVWLCDEAGQQLFWPPNVAGWDDTRWLDTSTLRARWNMVDFVLDGVSVNAWDSSHPYSTTENAPEALNRALASWGNPEMRPEHREELLDFAQRTESLATASWEKGPYRAMRQNALLQLIGISPDLLLQ
ncbi:MAG TPA: DUF1800 domain-containing protein [Solirubrobacterales bacterium]|jgi:uncharacterized protein (DUF1800 family)|nr:DUF1800 domain-containing protein [Solirubrobacterales bacterium]